MNLGTVPGIFVSSSFWYRKKKKRGSGAIAKTHASREM